MKATTKIKQMIKQIKTASQFKKAVEPPVKRLDGVRDMRQEAMDMGSHGAKEFFGGQDGSVR